MTIHPVFLLTFAQVACDFGVYVIAVIDGCQLENEK